MYKDLAAVKHYQPRTILNWLNTFITKYKDCKRNAIRGDKKIFLK